MLSELTNKRSFFRYPLMKNVARGYLYLLEKVTQQSSSFGSTVTSIASKLQTTHLVIFVLPTCYTQSSNKFDYISDT